MVADDKAVLISGRLVYSGLSGRNPWATKNVNNFVTFDATSQLKTLVEASRACSDYVVVVLWKEEASQALTIDLKAMGADVLTVVDNYPVALSPGGTPSKYKQFGPVLVGLDRIRSTGVAWTLRVRVDQLIDISGALSHVEACKSELSSDRIWWPASPTRGPLFLRDFYFGGPTQQLWRFFEFFVRTPEFSPNVHVDLFGKASYIFGEHNSQPRLTHFARYPNNFTQQQWSLAATLWSDYFATFPRAIWDSVRWRGSGERLGTPPEGALFEFSDVNNYWRSQPTSSAGRCWPEILSSFCYSWESYMRFRYGLEMGSWPSRLEHHALNLKDWLSKSSE